MRINHNVTAMVTANNLSNVNTGQGKVLQRLGSGQKINKAGDNSAGLAISEKMRGELAQLRQEKTNQQDLVAFTNAQDGALNEISNILVNLQQLVTQAGQYYGSAGMVSIISGDIMMNDVAINNIKSSINAGAEAMQTFLKSEMNGISLLSDASLAKVGAEYAAKTRTWSFYDTSASTIYHFATMEDVHGFINYHIGTYGHDVTDTGWPLVACVNMATDAVNELRGSIGSITNQAEAAVRNLSTQIENLQDAESRIRDADMAEETVEYQKNNILNQAATSMLAQANQQPQSVLSLLE